jgi:hypothetical protein
MLLHPSHQLFDGEDALPVAEVESLQLGQGLVEDIAGTVRGAVHGRIVYDHHVPVLGDLDVKFQGVSALVQR